jgi:hypothetical protein
MVAPRAARTDRHDNTSGQTPMIAKNAYDKTPVGETGTISCSTEIVVGPSPTAVDPHSGYKRFATDIVGPLKSMEEQGLIKITGLQHEQDSGQNFCIAVTYKRLA